MIIVVSWRIGGILRPFHFPMLRPNLMPQTRLTLRPMWLRPLTSFHSPWWVLTPTKRYGSGFPVLMTLFSVTTNQLFKKCTIWSVITSFTNIKFKELSGNNINSLTNVITLHTSVHKFFGQLHLWFEAVPVRCILLLLCPIYTLLSHKG